jgi:hypothetical protein
MSAKNAIDGALGAAGISSPFWLTQLQTVAGAVVAVGGAVLIVIRVMIAWRDWRNGKKDG